MIWFTSDTHFCHDKIIEYCNRPFASVEEMNEALINNWNDRVSVGDIVYHTGDFLLGNNSNKIPEIVKRLKGQIHLILGNHDQKRTKHLVGFADIKSYKEVKYDNQRIILCHFPFKVWNKSHHGSWNLHGHSHGSLTRDYSIKQLDVGVDCWNYRPLSYEDVKLEMEKHGSKLVDHHGQRDFEKHDL